jgi:adenylate cyclase
MTTRRLAAILAADVVGFSRLMGQDEEGTLARIKQLRRDLIEPKVQEHGGRVFKTTGDGFWAEFPSPVEAVRCALEVQEAISAEIAQEPSGPLQLRVGINLGDVIVEEDGDVYGDGVNVAARLQQLADPGGVWISGSVHDHVDGRIGASFENRGEQKVKNIAKPVRVYALSRAYSSGKTKLPNAGSEVAKPSIAVLPFTNMSGDIEQEYFADGVTEDIITELSRFRDLLVLARNSSFAFKGKPVDAVEAGRRLGVQFLLEGSVRKMGSRVRITAQLIDAATGTHLWTERYDRTLEDIFSVQDEVVSTIAATLAGRIELTGTQRAKRKPTEDLLAYDALLRGVEYLGGYGEETNAKAGEMFERAVRLDPNYALAKAFLALSIFVNWHWSSEWPAPTGLEEALTLAKEAVALDDQDSRCQRILATISLHVRQFDRADFHSDRALILNGNDAHAAAYRAFILIFLGHPGEAVDLIRRAMRLNPFHPAWYWNTLARALHAEGKLEEALAAYERITAPQCQHFAYMAACHAQLGHTHKANECVARTLEAKADFSSGVWLSALPFKRDEDRHRLFDELLAAGLPA